MSYDIFYDKQFVKVNDKTFIPMVLAGSNNCYDYNNKRERSWFNFSYILNGAIAGSMEKMLNIQAKTRAEKLEQYPDEYKDSSFGYYTSLSNRGGGCNMTYGQYIGIAKTGCAKALTIEQLREENVSLHIRTFSSDKTREALKEQGLEPISFFPKTTKELEDFINNVEPKYKGKKEGNLYASYSGMYEDTPKWIRKKYFKKVKAEKREVKSPLGYTVKVTNEEGSTLGYYLKGGRSFRYSHSKTGGKQFIDKKEAERLAKKRDGIRSDFKHTVVEVEYGYERTFYVPAGKKVVLPKKKKEVKVTDEELINSLDLRNDGEEVTNMFSPEQKCFLDPLGVALHDFIKGCEITKRYDSMQQALSIFREKYPEQYYVLLD